MPLGSCLAYAAQPAADNEAGSSRNGFMGEPPDEGVADVRARAILKPLSGFPAFPCQRNLGWA